MTRLARRRAASGRGVFITLGPELAHTATTLVAEEMSRRRASREGESVGLYPEGDGVAV